MRETGIFTGTTSSPSRSLRQSHDRYAIRAGRNLPDKEFRSLLLLHSIMLREPVISAGFCMSPCRSDCIFIRLSSESGVQSLRILKGFLRVFPADHLHPSIFTWTGNKCDQ